MELKEIPEKAATLHVSTVIAWTNGMVMVFDKQGQQMAEYQGPIECVKSRINDIFNEEWIYGDWKIGRISKSTFTIKR